MLRKRAGDTKYAIFPRIRIRFMVMFDRQANKLR